MNREDWPMIRLILLMLGLMYAVSLMGCNQYSAQKSPWAIGTRVELHDIMLPHTDPIIITAYTFDDIDRFDGNYHYFYSVRDAEGREYIHVIDYQLREVK